MTRVTRRALLAGTALVALMHKARAGFSQLMFNGGGANQPAFSSVTYNPQSAGGELGLGFSFANDNTLTFTPNSAGPWIWNSGTSQWNRLIDPSTLSGKFATTGAPNNTEGVATAVAPSNSNYMIAWFDGKLYNTSNKAASWTATLLTASFATVNSLQGPILAYDPFNYLKAVACSTSGTSYSLDGGATWATISGLASPSGSNGTAVVVFDPSTSGSVYIGVSGTGWYHSTTGVNGTFSLIGSQPTTTVYTAACDNAGKLYCSTTTNANVYIYNGSSWSTVTVPGGNTVGGIAVDPNTAGRIVINQHWDKLINVSTNSGVTWGGWSTGNATAGGDVTWLGLTGISVLAIQFHPTTNNLLFAATGTGVFTTSPPPTGTPGTVTWTGVNAGLGMLDTFGIMSSPGGTVLTYQWDRPAIPVYPVPGSSASLYLPVTGGTLYEGYSYDWAPNSSFIAGFLQGSSGVNSSGYSLDGGQTWTVFSDITYSGPSIGGNLAVSTPQNIVEILPNWQPEYTTNQGTSWTNCSGLPTTGWKQNYYNVTQMICADKVTSGTFYAVNSNGNCYKSTNSGATFSSVNSGLSINSSTVWLQSVPGQAGHIWYYNSGSSGLNYSTNGGTTFSAVSGVGNVYAMGFGKAYPGMSYPTVYLSGVVSGTYGIWRGVGNSPSTLTWTNLTASTSGYPNPATGEVPWQVYAISGDNTAFGWFYLGWQISGYLYGVSNDAAPWSVFTAPAQNATISHSGGAFNLTVSIASDINCTSCQFQVDGVNTGSPVTGSNLTTATLSYNPSGLSAAAHTFGAVLTGNGQTTTPLCYVTIT